MANATLTCRKEPRIPIRMFVNLYSPDDPNFDVTPTIDVSCHGARVVTKTFWKLNQHLAMRSIHGNLYARARVAYCQRWKDVKDLARFAYQGDEARAKYDLESLRTQGLVEEKTFFRAHKSARQIVTLTERGHRIVKKLSVLPKEQRIYHGIVKPRELDHDADLYKVYQKAVEQIQEKGGKPLRVRLDFELKESINREKEAAGHLPEEMRRTWLRAVAEEHGLTIDGTSIHLPDIQVEYETRDGSVESENLELLSRNYREDGIRGKAAAGFKIYARTQDTSRIRRALHDSGLVREVLSV